jgi:hypothetical protein
MSVAWSRRHSLEYWMLVTRPPRSLPDLMRMPVELESLAPPAKVPVELMALP